MSDTIQNESTVLSLNGNPIKKEIQSRLIEEIGMLTLQSAQFPNPPHLAIVLVGDNSRSKVFIEQKKKFASAIGVEVSFIEHPEYITTGELESSLTELAVDPKIHGIILQLPLPESFSKEDTERAVNTIPQIKDVDGITSTNLGYLVKESAMATTPATARGIVEMLKYYEIDPKGKHIVIVGKSYLVGKPVALTLLALDATVTVCHKETENLAEITRTADILISATGVSGLITKEFTKEGQVIIDIGISVNDQGEISGDVDPSVAGPDADPKIAALSPVPGGVGPMTVSGLFLNLIDLYKKQK